MPRVFHLPIFNLFFFSRFLQKFIPHAFCTCDMCLCLAFFVFCVFFFAFFALLIENRRGRTLEKEKDTRPFEIHARKSLTYATWRLFAMQRSVFNIFFLFYFSISLAGISMCLYLNVYCWIHFNIVLCIAHFIFHYGCMALFCLVCVCFGDRACVSPLKIRLSMVCQSIFCTMICWFCVLLDGHNDKVKPCRRPMTNENPNGSPAAKPYVSMK